MAGLLPVRIVSSPGQYIIFDLYICTLIHLEPGSEEEAAESGHLATVVELDRVVRFWSREVFEPLWIRVVTIGAAISQDVDSLMPEVEMQAVCMAGTEPKVRKTNDRMGCPRPKDHIPAVSMDH